MVDGYLSEAAWAGSANNVTHAVLGNNSTGENGQFKVRWDSNYLYVGVLVELSSLITPPSGQLRGRARPWRSTGYGPQPLDQLRESDDFRFVVGENNSPLFEKNGRTTGVLAATRNVSQYAYSVELAIPWSTLGATLAAEP